MGRSGHPGEARNEIIKERLNWLNFTLANYLSEQG